MKKIFLILFAILFIAGCGNNHYYNDEVKKYLHTSEPVELYSYKNRKNVFKTPTDYFFDGKSFYLYKKVNENGSEELFIYIPMQGWPEIKTATIKFKDEAYTIDIFSTKNSEQGSEVTGTTYGSKGGVYYDKVEVTKLSEEVNIPINPSLAMKMFQDQNFTIILEGSNKKTYECILRKLDRNKKTITIGGPPVVKEEPSEKFKRQIATLMNKTI